MSRYCKLTILLFLISCLPVAYGQGGKEFSVPLNDLEEWSKNIIVTFDDALIYGRANVHSVSSDCEMHFAASTDEYKGDPPGIVLEPMNVCVENFFGSMNYKKSQWISWANGLLGKHFHISGVPRLWPEHLDGHPTKSNPHHALEIHPLTEAKFGNSRYDFSKFIYAPDGFDGGLKDETARKILGNTEVWVEKDAGDVKIVFSSGTIGNFALLGVKIDIKSIKEMSGGHKMEGKVAAIGSNQVTVHLITVKGSDIDNVIEKLKGSSKQSKTLNLLVLFSLHPASLYDAAKKSTGQQIKVNNPLQLIAYGVKEIS